MSGLSVITEEPNSHFIATERLWLTAERDRLVVEGDPAAAFLFAAVGHRVSREDAERLGLIDTEPDEDTATAEQEPEKTGEQEQDTEPDEDTATAEQEPSRRTTRTRGGKTA